jgi:hypothetical protein
MLCIFTSILTVLFNEKLLADTLCSRVYGERCNGEKKVLNYAVWGQYNNELSSFNALHECKLCRSRTSA